MMNPFEAYEDYVALKLHFTSSYDYFKYNGRVKAASVTKFKARNDRYFFEKLAKKTDPHRFLVANLVEDSKVYIRDLVRDQKYDDIYMEHVKRNHGFAYWFSNDLTMFDTDLASNLRSEFGHPKALKLYLGKHISLETLTAVASLTGCVKSWRKRYADDDIVLGICTKIEKYEPFMTYDRAIISKQMIDTFKMPC